MILYFGNKLSKKRSQKSMLETLEPLLSEFVQTKSYSFHSNYVYKVIDSIIGLVLYHRKARIVLIDLFSTKYRYYAWIISYICYLLRIPYLIVLRGGNLPVIYSTNKHFFHSFFKDAASLIAPSEYLYHKFSQEPYPVKLIPNCLDLSSYKFKSDRAFFYPKILYVRGFGKSYNPEMCVLAIQMLKDKFTNISLTMIGYDIDGTLDTIHKLILKLGLSDQIKCLPSMTKEEWVRLSRSHDIMVSTPHIDNTPVSVMEGMILGLPVISTNVGGIPYLIKHKYNGILVADNAPQELAEAITLLMTNQELRQRIVENAHKDMMRFTWPVVKPQWYEIFKPYLD